MLGLKACATTGELPLTVYSMGVTCPVSPAVLVLLESYWVCLCFYRTGVEAVLLRIKEEKHPHPILSHFSPPFDCGRNQYSGGCASSKISAALPLLSGSPVKARELADGLFVVFFLFALETQPGVLRGRST